jgi:carbon storage regulator
MLVLSRRIGEEIVIGQDIRVRILQVDGQRIRIGISAPRTVTVDRGEVAQRRTEWTEEIELPAPEPDLRPDDPTFV